MAALSFITQQYWLLVTAGNSPYLPVPLMKTVKMINDAHLKERLAFGYKSFLYKSSCYFDLTSHTASLVKE